MPILLTTPFDPGDYDPGNSYTHANPVPLAIDAHAKRAEGYMIYGTFDGSVFTPAIGPDGRHIGKTILAQNDPSGDAEGYDDFDALLSADGEKAGAAALKAFCQWSITKLHFAGTVV